MNRFGRCAMVIGGALLVSGIVMQAPTFAASFETMGKPTFLYMDTRNVNLNAEGERVSFILQRDGVLRMCSRDGQHDYLSFTGYYGGNDGIGYSINKIEMKNPNKTFFVINANQGAHAKNAGFWIVGKYKGQWTCFVSLDTLANAGYTVGEWHQLKVVTDTTGYGTSHIQCCLYHQPARVHAAWSNLRLPAKIRRRLPCSLELGRSSAMVQHHEIAMTVKSGIDSRLMK